MIAEGFAFPPDIEEEEESFNSLNIFPGTDFMKHLSCFLDYYVSRTLQTRASCENLNVIVSDSDIPGEGEHKIMEFIRSQRTQPDYNPNQSHILHGLDADLLHAGAVLARAKLLHPGGAVVCFTLRHLRLRGPHVPLSRLLHT